MKRQISIAVLTWRLRNFGTALQSYALSQWLKNSDVDVRVINYNLPSSNELIKLNSLTFKTITKKICNRIIRTFGQYRNRPYICHYEKDITKSCQRFGIFYKRLPSEDVEPFKSNSHYYNDKYDCVIVGSDQVWSPKYLSETYFLDFVDDCKKVAYAPSLGVSHITETEAKFYADRLEKFAYVSVREKTAAQMLGLSNRVVVCDPTLLFTGPEWKTMLQLESVKDDYIFVYTLSANPWYKKVINKLPGLFNTYKIVVVTAADNLFFYSKDSYEIRVDVGPKEWMELLYNAKAVVTDSFHGVCFSVLFNKHFAVLKRFKDNENGSENSRVIDLMSELGVSNNLVQEGDDISISKFEPKSTYLKKLEMFREKSINYLTTVIKHYNNANH